MATACPECGGRRCLFCRDEGCDRLTSGWERSDRPNVKTEQIQGGEQQKSTDEDRARALRLGALPVEIQRLVIEWRKLFFESEVYGKPSTDELMSSVCEAFGSSAAAEVNLSATTGWNAAGDYILSWYEGEVIEAEKKRLAEEAAAAGARAEDAEKKRLAKEAEKKRLAEDSADGTDTLIKDVAQEQQAQMTMIKQKEREMKRNEEETFRRQTEAGSARREAEFQALLAATAREAAEKMKLEQSTIHEKELQELAAKQEEIRKHEAELQTMCLMETVLAAEKEKEALSKASAEEKAALEQKLTEEEKAKDLAIMEKESALKRVREEMEAFRRQSQAEAKLREAELDTVRKKEEVLSQREKELAAEKKRIAKEAAAAVARAGLEEAARRSLQEKLKAAEEEARLLRGVAAREAKEQRLAAAATTIKQTHAEDKPLLPLWKVASARAKAATAAAAAKSPAVKAPAAAAAARRRAALLSPAKATRAGFMAPDKVEEELRKEKQARGWLEVEVEVEVVVSLAEDIAAEARAEAMVNVAANDVVRARTHEDRTTLAERYVTSQSATQACEHLLPGKMAVPGAGKSSLARQRSNAGVLSNAEHSGSFQPESLLRTESATAALVFSRGASAGHHVREAGRSHAGPDAARATATLGTGSVFGRPTSADLLSEWAPLKGAVVAGARGEAAESCSGADEDGVGGDGSPVMVRSRAEALASAKEAFEAMDRGLERMLLEQEHAIQATRQAHQDASDKEEQHRQLRVLARRRKAAHEAGTRGTADVEKLSDAKDDADFMQVDSVDGLVCMRGDFGADFEMVSPGFDLNEEERRRHTLKRSLSPAAVPGACEAQKDGIENGLSPQAGTRVTFEQERENLSEDRGESGEGDKTESLGHLSFFTATADSALTVANEDLIGFEPRVIDGRVHLFERRRSSACASLQGRGLEGLSSHEGHAPAYAQADKDAVLHAAVTADAAADFATTIDNEEEGGNDTVTLIGEDGKRVIARILRHWTQRGLAAAFGSMLAHAHLQKKKRRVNRSL